MSWAQLTNRPNNVSHQYTTNHNNNTYYRKPPTNNNRIVINNNNNNNNGSFHPSQPRVGITSSKHKHTDINYVILDSGAFIGRQNFFNNFSPNVTYYMTPAVNHEIRDKQSRHFLDNFPYQIIVKKPDPQSVQYVSKFIGKNPTLRSLSKVDRQIIALAHTLELEKEGNKNIQLFENKKNKNDKAMSVMGNDNNKNKNKNNKKQIKKSKTGRIHSQAAPINDTGVRLAKLKKIIPFHFDDFMTMPKKEYGEKYGTPTPIEMIPHSPKFKGKLGLKDIKKLGNESKTEAMDGIKAVKYNPNIKAKTETGETMSKSQRRRKRKKMARNVSKELSAENVLEFGLIDDENEEKDSDNNNNEEETIVNNKEEEKKQAKPKDKVIDINALIEDTHKEINETASLISSLSAQSAKHKKQINDINKRNKWNNTIRQSQVVTAPMISQSQSQPVGVMKDNNNGFGTMFNGQKGSIFGSNGSNGNKIINEKKPMTLPALPQNKEIVEKKTTNDAWNGDWLGPQNFKKVSKNNAKNKQKKKLKNVTSENNGSSVAVITVDKAMQRCMVDMGLRVMSTTTDRQYGSGSGGNNNNNNNNEPVNYIFRCYGCFQNEYNTNRTHCRWCGGQTYQRVAIYEDQNGKHHYRYYYKDRYGHKYLDKHSLVPRGSQLVKYNQTNHMGNNQNQKRRKKKRSYLGNNNNYRGGGGQNRW